MPNKEDDMREHIAQALPLALLAAMESYQFFLEQEVSNEAKEFKAHHDAGKAAIAHIELLIKLASWAGVEDAQDQEIIKSVIENGTIEKEAYDNRQSPDRQTE